MIIYSYVTPEGWYQIDDSATIARVTPDGWEQIAQGTPTLTTISPVSDITVGAWTSSLGGALYAAIDENPHSDTDYINTTSASTAEVKFAVPNTPEINTYHTIKYRAKGEGTLETRLYQGTTLIATHNPTLTGSFQTFTWNLSEGEAASITNYSDLRVRFIGS